MKTEWDSSKLPALLQPGDTINHDNRRCYKAEVVRAGPNRVTIKLLAGPFVGLTEPLSYGDVDNAFRNGEQIFKPE